MFNDCIYAQSELQPLGCWNSLDELVLSLLYYFHRKHLLKKLITKLLSRKLNVKNIKKRVYKYIPRQSNQGLCNLLKSTCTVELRWLELVGTVCASSTNPCVRAIPSLTIFKLVHVYSMSSRTSRLLSTKVAKRT